MASQEVFSRPDSLMRSTTIRGRFKGLNNLRRLSTLWHFCYFVLLFFQSIAPIKTLQRLSMIDDDDLVVKTSSGVIRGTIQKFDGRIVRAFLGVPYAQKPTGNRRFAVPEMISPWEGEFKADTPALTCFYTIDRMFPGFPGAEMWNPSNEIAEDCLSLNFWIPDSHDGSVMVWIYGGGFFSGSPSLDLYDGRVLALSQGVIVININYSHATVFHVLRLGPFGFLYFGDDSRAPGNVGLLDQQLALKWIHENIGYFGGDKSRITLFGESSGGASATSHMFSPESARLFSRVVAKSSAITNNWATKPKSMILELSLHLAKRLNCSSELDSNHSKLLSSTQSTAAIECMARVPASKLQLEADAISESLPMPMTFAFVPIEEDNNFFKGNVFEKLRKGDFKKDISLVVGTVRDEGTYWLPYYLPYYGFHFNHTLSAEDHSNQALISESEYIRAFDAFHPYFGGSQLVRHGLLHAYSRVNLDYNGPSNRRWRDGIARFLGDNFFTCALIEFADVVADHVYGSVYMYYFTKRSSANPWPKWMGVMHGYEIEYVFGVAFREPKLYESNELDTEQTFSRKMMDFWGNFAKTGEPIEYWPKYNRVTRKSLVLSEELAIGNSHRIYVDVHGKLCRLLEEAETFIKIERSSARITSMHPKDEVFRSRFGFIHSGSAPFALIPNLLTTLILSLSLSLIRPLYL